jgi:serine O-acetyltransferase
MSSIIYLHRIGNFFYRLKLKPLANLMSLFIRFIFSCWLPSSATIGKNFKLGYGGLGVVIHSNSVIGDNCLVAQNVTIGRNFGDTLVPRIGDDVYIGAGSVVFGEIIIGNNVIIGPNSLVNKNIPDNCTVVGNPLRIIVSNRREKYHEIHKK